LEKGDTTDLLPTTIDYAAGSGHFLTESMEEIQNILKDIDKDNLRPDVKKDIQSWDSNFDWAYNYMYGIEKDYRLVKTAKV
jgi:type I restriction enzyme M protein